MIFIIIALPALFVWILQQYLYRTKSFWIHLLGTVLAIGLMMCLAYGSLYTSMYDHQILNGKVLEKYKDVETCTQNSSCKHYVTRKRCKTTKDSSGNRHESCTTYKVFDYPYEVDWIVKTSVDTHTIERENRQGTLTPERWKIVKIGEPASTSSGYINYLLGNKDSLFFEQNFEKKYSPEYRKTLPDYPEVYDYYRVNHVINLTGTDVSSYNDYIDSVLSTVGESKQLNIVLVLYPGNDATLPEALTSKWRGGKKNDVIMFAGLDSTGTVSKFSSTSFGKGMNNEVLHSTLRMNALTEKMSIELVKVLVQEIEKDFKRLPNEEFEYLKYKLNPSWWVVILCSMLAAGLSFGIGIYLRGK